MRESPELRALVYDHHSGARELAERLLLLLQREATRSKATTSAGLLDGLFVTAVHVLRAHPEMAILFNLVDRVFREAEAVEAGEPDVGAARMGTVAALGRALARQQERLDAAAEAAAACIRNGDLVVTHSRSSTVAAALKAARRDDKMFDVVVTEARPLLEGRTLARQLAADQIPVRIVVDAAVGTALTDADHVLVGADAITHDGLVNKVGTRLLALAAREADVPVTVAAATDKAWRRRPDPSLGLGDARLRAPGEVWDRAPPGVEVVNLTFDHTPHALLERVASEVGAGPFEAYWRHVAAEGTARRILEVFNEEMV